MKKIVNLVCGILAAAMVFSLAACGNQAGSDTTGTNTGSSNEDYFLWTDNVICGLTEEGAKQTSLVIPARCEGFEGMFFMDEENSVTSVSFEGDHHVDLNGVFGGGEKLTSIELPSGQQSLGIQEFVLCTSLESITIPASVKEIGASAFQYCTSLKEVTIEGATVIDQYAFDGCAALQKLALSDSVETISKYAFYDCKALETVTLPKSLSVVGEFAFANTGLLTLNVPADLTLTDFDTTSFAQGDHETDVHVTAGSWMDTNFDKVFAENYNKNVD